MPSPSSSPAGTTALRGAGLGAAALGLPGGVVGLILGLHVYAPTAWAAAFEVGLPAAAVGAGTGLLVGAARRRRTRPTASGR